MVDESSHRRWLVFVVAGCMILSGGAGLVYEVAWARMLGVFLGATAHAHAVVLAGFLGGLAVGNAVVGRMVDRRPHQALLIYAVLEAAIGLYGLASPAIQSAFGSMYLGIAGSSEPGPGLFVLKLTTAAAFVLLPTVAMGGTIPALTRFLVRDVDQVGTTVARLYLVNTVGAALGCFMAGMVLIPAMGVMPTVRAAAVVNLLIAAITWGLHIRTRVPALEEAAEATGPAPSGNASILVAVFVMGIATLTLEVSWTRVFSMVFGSSAQAFTLMLTAFIAGIALGSAFAPRWLNRFRGREADLLGILLIASACVLVIQMPLYEHLPYWQFKIAHTLERRPHVYPVYLAAQAAVAFAWMMPLTIATGAVLPVAAHVYTQRIDSAGRSVGRLFAANTIGNVLGPLLATFMLFPLVGVQRAIGVGVFGLALSAGIVVRSFGSRYSRHVLVLGAVLSVVAVTWARWEPSLMHAGGFRRWTLPHGATFAEFRESRMNSRPVFEHESATDSVVVLETRDHQFFMKVNGKTDASDAEDLLTQRMVAHIPLLLHRAWTDREEREVYVVGVGSGVTAGSASIHPGVEVTAVEISEGVLRASELFDHVNRDVHSLENVTIHHGDAREFIERSEGPWDVIINQPSNPWIAGNAALFSREFYLSAREKLAEDGVFAQWMHVYAMDDETVRIVMNTFASVFPHVTLWWPQGVDLLLIGSTQEVDLDLDMLDEAMREPTLWDELNRYSREGVRVTTLDRLLALQTMSSEGFRTHFPGEPPFTSDLRPTLEFRAPVAQFVGARAEIFVEIDERLIPGDSTDLYWGGLERSLSAEDLAPFFAERETPFSEQLAGSLLYASLVGRPTPGHHRTLATGGTGLPILLEAWADTLIETKEPQLSDCSDLLSTAKTVLPIRATAFFRPELSQYHQVVEHCRGRFPDAMAFLRAMETEIYHAVGRYDEAAERARRVLAVSQDPAIVEAMNALMPATE